MNRIRELSADEEARRLAFVRERALHDEVSFLNEARREGREEGRQEGFAGLLRTQLMVKFGDLPDWIDETLSKAPHEQLNRWGTQLLTAHSLDDLFKP